MDSSVPLGSGRLEGLELAVDGAVLEEVSGLYGPRTFGCGDYAGGGVHEGLGFDLHEVDWRIGGLGLSCVRGVEGLCTMNLF